MLKHTFFGSTARDKIVPIRNRSKLSRSIQWRCNFYVTVGFVGLAYRVSPCAKYQVA